MQRSINFKHDYNVIVTARKIIKNINPDIVHLHSAKAGVIGRFACLGLVSSKNVYYSPHGFSFVQQNISKVKTYFFKFLEYAMPFLFGGTIVASGNTEFKLAKKISKSILIKNGVDFELPDKIFSKTQNDRLKIGTVGRLTPQKNPKAFDEIAALFPSFDFVWIGDGELVDQITSKNKKVDALDFF